MAKDLKPGGGDAAAAVRAYYQANTKLFLSLGIGAKSLAMRRAVWADGVASLSEAVDYVNTLIAAEAASCRSRTDGDPLRVIDIGCGVGGSLVFLCRAADGPLHGVGVTISPRQAQFARRQARMRGLARQLSFRAADFTAVNDLRAFHCAFAIESFAHFAAPTAFFSAAARALVPGGRLIVVDDFLSGGRFSPRERRLIAAFRNGWLLASLCTVGCAAGVAAECGLRLAADRDLSPCLSQLPVNASVLSRVSLAVRALPVPWSYWRSTAGSLALAACQKARLVEYHVLIFEKREA